MENLGHLLLPQFSEETRAGGCAQSRAPAEGCPLCSLAPRVWWLSCCGAPGVGHRGLGLQVSRPESDSSREGLAVTMPALWHLVTGAHQARGFSEQVSEQFLSCAWCSVMPFLSSSFQLSPSVFRGLVFK